MKRYFHGENKTGPYFEGWYFKCRQADGSTVALIPALHIDDSGRRSASVQVIAPGGVWWLEYPQEEFSASQQQLRVQLGNNLFSESGITLKIEKPGISVHGTLQFGPFLRLESDIMGPFRFLPNMECTHGVISMAHSLQGQLVLNGTALDFSGGTGYIETDRGRAFPNRYLWTQCTFPGGSLMLSIASIPFAGLRFTGCICAIVYKGEEYRLATYRGVRVERWSDDGAVIRQGKYRLQIDVLEKQPQPLRAPVNGIMGRTIHESVCTRVRCRFWCGDRLLFYRTDDHGSFEYATLPEDNDGND